jgi:hypothetical protein
MHAQGIAVFDLREASSGESLLPCPPDHPGPAGPDLGGPADHAPAEPLDLEDTAHSVAMVLFDGLSDWYIPEDLARYVKAIGVLLASLDGTGRDLFARSWEAGLAEAFTGLREEEGIQEQEACALRTQDYREMTANQRLAADTAALILRALGDERVDEFASFTWEVARSLTSHGSAEYFGRAFGALSRRLTAAVRARQADGREAR